MKININKKNKAWILFMMLLVVSLVVPVFCAEKPLDAGEGYLAVDVKISAISSSEGKELAKKINVYRKAAGVGEVKYSAAAEQAAQMIALAYAVEKWPLRQENQIAKYCMQTEFGGLGKSYSTGSFTYGKSDSPYSANAMIAQMTTGNKLTHISYYYDSNKYFGYSAVKINNIYYFGVVFLPEDNGGFEYKSGNITQKTIVPTSKVGGVVMSGKSEVGVGKSIELNANLSIKGQFETINGELSGAEWTSSDESIATVSSDGKVKGLNPGKVKIKVKAGKKSASKEITVTDSTGENSSSKGSVSKKIKTPAELTVKAEKNAMKVTWKNQKTNTTGYEIQYSTDKKFKKNVKTVEVKKAASKSKTIKKVKPGKTYYVRIRAIQKKNGKLRYSKWSDAKKCKINK